MMVGVVELMTRSTAGDGVKLSFHHLFECGKRHLPRVLAALPAHSVTDFCVLSRIVGIASWSREEEGQEEDGKDLIKKY